MCPWIRESAVAALCCPLLSVSMELSNNPMCLLDCKRQWESRKLSRMQPQSKESEQAAFAAAVHIRIPSIVWTILKARCAVWCERQISVFWNCLVHLIQNAEHFSWKTSLLYTQHIQDLIYISSCQKSCSKYSWYEHVPNQCRVTGDTGTELADLLSALNSSSYPLIYVNAEKEEGSSFLILIFSLYR